MTARAMPANAPTRPVLRYHGGKYRVAPWIISHFPAHRVYVEPFGGAASVLMRKPRADFEVYNDLDADVVNVFRVLRDPDAANRPADLLRLTPWARAEFYEAYEPSADAVERARRTIVRTFMGHGTTSLRRNRTGFRSGSHPSRAGGGFGDWRGYPEQIAAFVDRLRGVVIEERDALELIARHNEADVLLYVDPPYVASTRSSVRGPADHDRCYRHDLSDDAHRQLAVSLHCHAGPVVLSGYACPMYDEELYAGWGRHEKAARGDRGVDRTEVVWLKPAGVRQIPKSLVQGSLHLEKSPEFPAQIPAVSGVGPGASEAES